MRNNYSKSHICQCLTRIATSGRSFPVTISGDRKNTGEKFVEGVLSLASGLLQLGLCPGDIVAISAFNSDWYLEWLLAVAFVGGIAAPLNYRWSSEEARYAVSLVQPVMLVTDESCHHWHSICKENETLSSIKWYVSLASPSSFLRNTQHVLDSEEIKKSYIRSQPLDYLTAPQGAVIVCFTSGTTGRPKGVTITHSALIVQSLAKIALVGYNEDDVYLHTAPLCHIGGLSSAMAMLMSGACHVFIPKFEVQSAFEAIELYNVTSLITVPTMMADLISFIREKDDDWKGKESIKKILNGGGSLSMELTKDAIKFFPNAKLVSAYGMTETCSSITFMPLYDPKPETSSESTKRVDRSKSSSVYQVQGVCVGKPAPHVDIKICFDESSSNVGRILTRGPHLMVTYWGQAPPTDTWFDTGDVGSVDDYGNIWLIGRKNGRIKSGGENVYPEEVETILSQYPGVSICVVLGIPDSRLTEMVVACVQLRENWNWSDTAYENSNAKNEMKLSSQILQNYCRENHLTRFKIPRKFVLWRKPFPVTSSGKIKRDIVRSEVISNLQSLLSNL